MTVFTDTHVDEIFDTAGNVIQAVTRIQDVTADVVTLDLHAKARAAMAVNAAFLALPTPSAAQVAAQVKALTRQNNALIRLLVGSDLLTDNTGT